MSAASLRKCLLYRLVGFRGWPALVLKFSILGIVDIVGGLAASSAVAANSWWLAGALIATLLFINWVYLFRTPTAARFMAPGIVFLLAFVVVPILYTVAMSGFKFQTGNIITKDDAIVQVINRSISEDASGTAYDMTFGRTADGEYAALLKNQLDGTVSLATPKGLRPLVAGEYSVNEYDVPNAAPGFVALTPDELSDLGDGIMAVRFPAGNGAYVSPQYAELAILLTQDLTYDPDADVITSASTGAQYVDGGSGNFVAKNNPEDVLEPGWRTTNFPENFTKLVTDPSLRDPFFRVFLWTVIFALLSVITTFAVGLLLALAMDKKIRGRAVYRSILILPYAIPSFMSILVWRGMFNREFGIVNRLLLDVGLISESIGWLDSTATARFVVVLVNLWLGFPYMYLISTGALQAIPTELKEAAAIDGASPFQAFRRITLPLLLQILSPMLISTFAFNFNNFNIIYLLTEGGPREAIAGERAGGTDILISYAYQTAISAPTSRDFGMASAISMFMFIIVAGLSLVSIRRTKSLEEF